MKKIIRIALLLIPLLIFLAGTASAQLSDHPNQTDLYVDPATVSVGLVTDPAGIADMGGNWLAYQGLLHAQADFGIQINLYEPASVDDFAPFLQQCADDGNQLCFGVGFRLADAIETAANNNPATSFAILNVDWVSAGNLRNIMFASDEVGYLAGVLAGRMTTSDVLGVIGGLPIPSVDAYIDGFQNGALCTNPDVNVLIQYSNNFEDPAGGIAIAEDMIAQGADVIYGVAGPTSDAALVASAQAGKWAVGVDIDHYIATFDNGNVTGSAYMLTSAMKNWDNAVYMTIDDYLQESFTPGIYLYDLAVDGVGLAPFHEADLSIPVEVKDELAAVRQGIIDGVIDVNDPCIVPEDVSVGLVTDTAGIADMGGNWLAYQGLLHAQADFGIQINLYEPASVDDFAPFLQQCADDGNQLCFGVGFRLADAIETAANNNPATSFAILDVDWVFADNLRDIMFASDEIGYLAGVLAARMTTTDVLGVIGGYPLPSVEAYIQSYRNGALCTNPEVNVLIEYSGDFYNPELGVSMAEEMIAQGADVIYGVAGPTSDAALVASAQAGKWAVGVDIDHYIATFDNGNVAGSAYMLTSAMKNWDNAVYMTIDDYLQEVFTPGINVYDLASDGVGLAPFHEADPSIPPEVKDELAAVRQGIIDGVIDVNDPCTPERPPINAPLFVGDTQDIAGYTKVWNDAVYLYINFQMRSGAGYCIEGANVHLGTSLGAFPTDPMGYLIPDQFTYRTDLNGCLRGMTGSIPLIDLAGLGIFRGDDFFLAINGETFNRYTDMHETGWAARHGDIAGSQFPGPGWETYILFTHISWN